MPGPRAATKAWRWSSSSSSCMSMAPRRPKMCAKGWPWCARRCAPRSRSRACSALTRPSRAVWSLAVLPEEQADGSDARHAADGNRRSAVELTTWAEQVLKKRLENVRGVGAVRLVGPTRREINLYLNPQALEAFAITPEQVVDAVRNENQNLPVGAIRSLTQDR